MSNKAVQTTHAKAQRSTTPCRVCQIQLGIEWIRLTNQLLVIWSDRTWARTMRNKAFWGVLSVSAVVSLYWFSDEPYYCGEGRQRRRGHHFWGREAADATDMVQWVNNGAQRLAAWFRERCAFSQISKSTQGPETDDDYDLCEVEK